MPIGYLSAVIVVAVCVAGPILIHFHGGAFRMGRKNRDGRPLVNRLTRRGWLCISADYRIGRRVAFPDPLIDAKRVIAWARAHAHQYGADPEQVYVAGSSAGAHLAATAALTVGDPAYQPGFESADTSVAAAICCYGYYGPTDDSGASSPHDHIGGTPPPFLVVHGALDTVAIVEDARDFVAALRAVSTRPVVSAELPGGQHNFDLFHSIRCEAVIDAVETFTAAVRGSHRVDG